MWSIIQAAGWPIWPLIFASIIALALIFERLWSLRTAVVAPPRLVDRVLAEYRQHGATPELLAKTAALGPLGRVLAAGLANVKAPRPVMKEAIEEVGRVVTHDLERFLTSLGTIAAMSPLLGLLGTVVGMIEIFGSQSATGSNPIQLAHGISIALYNTAMGIIVAIPSLIFYRHFRAKIDALVVEMEQQAIKLVDFAHGGPAMNLRGRMGRDDPEINFIPLIDVLLVILIFLMVTTTYQRVAELQITLPEADAEAAKNRPKEINVGIDAQGRYVIDKSVFTFTTVGALADMLRRAATDVKDPVVIINADANATHQSVVHVMEAARQAGLLQITFATQTSTAK